MTDHDYGHDDFIGDDDDSNKYDEDDDSVWRTEMCACIVTYLNKFTEFDLNNGYYNLTS
jgi:hypothetical protein